MADNKETAIKIRSLLCQFIAIIKNMVDQANKSGLSKFETKDVEFALSFLENYDADAIVLKFLEKSHLWEGVRDKSLDYIMKEAPQFFPATAFNSQVLVEPIRLYMARDALCKKHGLAVKQFPITDADIDTYWSYLNRLIKGGNVYNNNLPPTKRYKITYTGQ